MVSYYPPAWGYGGPPKVMFELARRHANHGHEVEVFTTDALDAHHRVEDRTACLEGVRVNYFRNLSNLAAWKYKKFLPWGVVSALSRRARTFDVIHISDSRSWMTLHGYRAAKRSGIPVVLSAFGSLGRRSAGVQGLMKTLYDRRWVVPMIRGAGALLAQTAHEVRMYAEFGADPSRIALVPLGIDFTEFESLPQVGKFRSVHGIRPEEKLILFVGRIHPTKGIALLVRALAELRRGGEAWRLVIVGVDNGALSDVENLVAELGLARAVIFTGPLYNRDKLSVTVDADVFAITPVIFEETSLAALEACAAGLPAVVTEQADIPGLDQACAGRVVPRDLEALVSALRQVVLTRSDAREMGQRARCLVRENFSWDVIAKTVEDVFTACANR